MFFKKPNWFLNGPVFLRVYVAYGCAGTVLYFSSSCFPAVGGLPDSGDRYTHEERVHPGHPSCVAEVPFCCCVSPQKAVSLDLLTENKKSFYYCVMH